jgi:hypothetical protein
VPKKERSASDVSDDEARLLKAIAADLVENIWNAEFYNDAENYIIYKNPKKGKDPRPDREVKQIRSELNRLKNDLIDEIAEEFSDAGITKFEDIRQSFQKVQAICHRRFADYRRRLWNVVKPEIPPE